MKFAIKQFVKLRTSDRCYVGTVRKIVVEEKTIKCFVEFEPGSNYISYLEESLEPTEVEGKDLNE